MLAIVKSEKKPGAKLEERPNPKPGPNDVLIKIKAASICGTDAQIYEWNAWAEKRIKPPIIFGHEFCGDVVEVGSMVQTVAVGDFVSAESHIPCGYCFQCRNDQMHICKNLKILGVDTNGGFAEYISLPSVCAWKNPTTIKPQIASIMEPLGNAVYTALADEITGLSVAVFGCGPSGLFTVGVCAASGAGPVISVIKHEFRRKIAQKMGAAKVLKVGENDIVAEIMKATGGEGVDVALEMSGSPDAIHQAFQVVKKGGRISFFGIPTKPVDVNFADEIIFKGLRIYGINGRLMYKTWYKMKNLLESGKLDPSPVITHEFSFKDFEKGMTAMIAPDRSCGKVILHP